MTCRIGVIVIACVLPVALSAQTPVPPDTGSLVLIIARDQAQSSRAADTLRVAGARVTLKSGALLGTADDSGSVVASGLPAGRVELTFRAKDYAPINCRLNVRAGSADTVRVNMQLERKVIVWSSPGCKQRR